MKTRETLPFKVLDAPDLSDNFYYSVLSWSKQNIIALGLQNAIYGYSPDDNSVNSYIEAFEDVTCVQHTIDGTGLAYALNNGSIEVMDLSNQKSIYLSSNHSERVGVLTFYEDFGPHVFVSGSKDKTIVFHDLRKQKPINIINKVFF
jgi:WD40 repeat protein